METYLLLGFQLCCLVMNNYFYFPVPLKVVAYASCTLYVLLTKTTSWFGWLYWIVWYTCASTVAVPIGYGWPFMQWLSENGSCVFESDYRAIILQFQNIGSVLYKSLKKDTYFRSKLFPELWNWPFFPPVFLKLRFWCLRPVQAHTKSSSLEVPSWHNLNRLPESFIPSTLPTALSYLGKLLMVQRLWGEGGER